MKNLPLLILAILIIVFTYILTSCVTAQDYQKQLDSWVGATDQMLVESWGGPDSTTKTSEFNEIYTYVINKDSTYLITEGSNTGRIHVRWCKVTFFITNHTIKKVISKGNGCY